MRFRRRATSPAAHPPRERDRAPAGPALAQAMAQARPWRPPQRSAAWHDGHALTRRPSAGGEPHGSRTYQPGDDPRLVDWPATARTGELQVRVGPVPKVATVRVLVDLTASMYLGARRPKVDAAIEAAALVTFSALRAGIPVLLAAFSGAGVTVLGPATTPAAARRILQSLVEFDPEPGPLTVAEALELLPAVSARPGWTVIVTDLRDRDDGRRLIRAVQAGGPANDCVFIVLDDPFDTVCPPGALVTLRDVESGQVFTVDTTDPVVTELFTQQERDHHHLMSTLPAATVSVPTIGTIDAVSRWLRQGVRS